MKKWTSVFLALAICLTLAACGGGKTDTPPQTQGSGSVEGEEKGGLVTTLAEPVELQFWHSISNPVHLEILEDLVAEFNATTGQEKNISVTATFNGSSAELYSNVIAAIKAQNAPDVSLALRPYVADYLQTGFVVDLDPYLQDAGVGIQDYEDIFLGLRQANASYNQEGTFSLPIHSYSEVLYYNVDFFNRNGLTVPTTWEEMQETCEKIHAITGSPAFGWDNLSGSFMTLVHQFGGRYTDAQGNLFFAGEDEEVALKVLSLWQDNVNQGLWRTAGEDMFFSGPFANEQIPMYIGDSVEASYIPSKNPELNWATAPIPQADESRAANLCAGHVIVALNPSGSPERAYASYEFMKFMTSYEANLAVVTGGTGYLPIRQSVVDSEAYQSYVADGHDFLTAGVAQSGYYFYEPAFTNGTTTSSAVNGAVKTMMQEVADNGVAPADALANLKQSVGLS